MSFPWRSVFFLFIIKLLALSGGCGISFSGDANFLDPEPPGTRLHSASFTSLDSTRVVSGIVAIYQNGGGPFVVRLENFDAPSDQPLRLVAVSASCGDYVATLKGFQGNQNYNTGLTGCGDFSVVRIRTVAGIPPSNEIAQGNFN